MPIHEKNRKHQGASLLPHAKRLGNEEKLVHCCNNRGKSSGFIQICGLKNGCERIHYEVTLNT